MALRRTSLGLDRWIWTRPTHDVEGPVCALCDAGRDKNDFLDRPRVVDYEELVEGQPGVEDIHGNIIRHAGTTWCKVLVRHHGAEELVTFDFGSLNWGPTELASMMRKKRWFDPQADGGHAEDGRLVVGV